MLRDFIAIDFETANQEPSSVCSVGVVMVRDGQIVDSFYRLIQPEPNYYNYWCQRVHGLSESDTEDAPVFSKVWQQLEERIVEVYPITSYTPLLLPVAMTYRIITTPWPMPKPVQLSHYTYYKYVTTHHIFAQFIPDIL